jgi:hypothetical protein
MDANTPKPSTPPGDGVRNHEPATTDDLFSLTGNDGRSGRNGFVRAPPPGSNGFVRAPPRGRMASFARPLHGSNDFVRAPPRGPWLRSRASAGVEWLRSRAFAGGQWLRSRAFAGGQWLRSRAFAGGQWLRSRAFAGGNGFVRAPLAWVERLRSRAFAEGDGFVRAPPRGRMASFARLHPRYPDRERSARDEHSTMHHSLRQSTQL